MSCVFRLYKLINWLRDVKGMNVTEYQILCGVAELNDVRGRAIKSTLTAMKIVNRTDTAKYVNQLYGKGYVAMSERINPFVASSITLTVKGKILLTSSKKMLSEE